MGKFSSGVHYIYYCAQESLRRKGREEETYTKLGGMQIGTSTLGNNLKMIGLQRRVSTEELMLSNCGAGEGS